MTLNEIIAEVHEFLEQGRPSEALALMNRSGPKSPIIDNACGVCHLRMGHYDRALNTFRELAFPHGSACMDHGVPIPFQTNFVTTMLLLGHIAQGLTLLGQIPNPAHPAVARLRQVIAEWKTRHGKMKRFLFAIGIYGGASFTMETPGDLHS